MKRGVVSDEEEDQTCPVCYETLTKVPSLEGRGRGDSNTSCFPCGHTICSRCDDQLNKRGFHTCPICRTVRDGWDQQSANLARDFARIQEQSQESGNSLQYLGSRMINGSNNSRYEVIFLSNEAEGTPFGPIQRAIDTLINGSASSIESQHRREHNSEGDEETNNSNNEDGVDGAVQDVSDVQEEGNVRGRSRRHVIEDAILPVGLRNLIHSLRSPQPLSEFMQARSNALAPR